MRRIAINVKLGSKKKVYIMFSVYFESYLSEVPSNTWWLDTYYRSL